MKNRIKLNRIYESPNFQTLECDQNARKKNEIQARNTLDATHFHNVFAIIYCNHIVARIRAAPLRSVAETLALTVVRMISKQQMIGCIIHNDDDGVDDDIEIKIAVYF